MATVTRTHVFADGDTLTASQLNAEFNNVLNALSLVNADISASAAIAYSKLNLTGAITNADLAGSIAATKISNTAAVLSGNTFTGKNTFTNTVQTLTTYTPSIGGTATIDLSLGNINLVTVPAGNITIALSGGTTGQVFVIRFLNDSSVRTVTWFTTIKWPGGSAPALSGSSKVDAFAFIITGTNTYDGYIVGQSLS